jgi:hypothetical protein
MVFASSLPNLGRGALRPRDETKATAEKEISLINAQSEFYKSLAAVSLPRVKKHALFSFTNEFQILNPSPSGVLEKSNCCRFFRRLQRLR